jgi:hypothetical protein
MRKEQFRRPEPGFSLYEGRTRGKRMKYTYSDDEADFYSDSTNRRSTRNTRHHTPAEPSGPLTTASGRQVRAPNRLNAENASTGAPSASTSVQGDGDDAETRHTTRSGRPQRSAAANHGLNAWAGKKRKSEEYESEESEEEGSEPDFGDDEEEEHVPDESEVDEEEFEQDEVLDEDLEVENPSFVFKFPIRVSFDEDSKVRQIPGPPVVVEKHKYARAAHRNVVVSDDSETSGASPEQPIITEPEPPAADVIAVATKSAVTEPQPEINAGNSAEPADKTETAVDQSKADTGEVIKSPPTPSSEKATSLALRGSPEVAKSVPRVVGITPAE